MAVRVVFVLCAVLGSCCSLECPASFAPATDLSALGSPNINLYLDESDFDGGKFCPMQEWVGLALDLLAALPQRIDLIASSEVRFPFDSLELLRPLAGLAAIPASLTSATVHLQLEAGERDVYFSVGVWSLNDSLASAGCVQPGLDLLAPAQDIGRLRET